MAVDSYRTTNSCTLASCVVVWVVRWSREMSKSRNGPEPTIGSWVIASISDCPDRYRFVRTSEGWFDEHPCKRTWEELVDPIDALPPEDL